MFLTQNEFYHIYNRGNNKQPIFFNAANYIFFIKKIRTHLLPVSDVIAYCLLPNHFHLIIHANENTIKERKSFGGKPMQEFAYQVGLLQSSYSQAVNKQNHTSGSIFQQKAKAKMLVDINNGVRSSYLENCFFYVHNNSTEARLVNDLAEWPYSSFPDYSGKRNGTLCKKELFYHSTGLTVDSVRNWSNWHCTDEQRKNFF